MPVSPPRPKGPPLNALRAFEAAARLGGFAAAANELCVTPGAVAQHVKSLEAWAGASLFERRSQGVRLTSLGAGVMEEFSAAFDQLGTCVQTLRARAAPKHVRIAALPSIAQLWLSPRLPAIRLAAPDVTISVTALEWQPNLRREPYDLSIFYEDMPQREGAETRGSIVLCRDVIFPVCAPAVASRLHEPADLNDTTCIHDSTWSNDWQAWLGSLPQARNVNTDGPVFSLYSLALEEAKNGAGVIIGHEALVQAHLETGALVAPFRSRVTLDRTLSLAIAGSGTRSPQLAAVIRALTGSARS